MAPPPIVITSINPFAKLEYQLRCFKAWQAAGFDVRTANVEKEAGVLKSAGLSAKEIILLKTEETGQALFGKPVPKVKAVLLRAQALSQGKAPVMLVNSDLYPAMRGTGAVAFWGALAPMIAMTREDCPLVESYNYTQDKAYRGGLDAFCMQADALAAVVQKLQDMAVSERMCFGIPGWDYMMGAIALSPQIGGRIMDSGLLLHEIHRNTYTNVQEFSHYLPDIRALSEVRSEDAAQGAAEFSRIIRLACEAETRNTQLAKMMFLSPITDTRDISAAAAEIARFMIPFTPSAVWHGNQIYTDSLAARMLLDDCRNFPRAIGFFAVNPDPQYKFCQVLAAILLSLLCQVKVKSGKPTMDYPKGNLHAKAVQGILDGYAPGSGYRRLDFAQLFGAELIEHRIFNPRLYNYMVLSCESDLERKIMTEIWIAIRRLANAT